MNKKLEILKSLFILSTEELSILNEIDQTLIQVQYFCTKDELKKKTFNYIYCGEQTEINYVKSLNDLMNLYFEDTLEDILKPKEKRNLKSLLMLNWYLIEQLLAVRKMILNYKKYFQTKHHGKNAQIKNLRNLFYQKNIILFYLLVEKFKNIAKEKSSSLFHELIQSFIPVNQLSKKISFDDFCKLK